MCMCVLIRVVIVFSCSRVGSLAGEVDENTLWKQHFGSLLILMPLWLCMAATYACLFLSLGSRNRCPSFRSQAWAQSPNPDSQGLEGRGGFKRLSLLERRRFKRGHGFTSMRRTCEVANLEADAPRKDRRLSILRSRSP